MTSNNTNWMNILYGTMSNKQKQYGDRPDGTPKGLGFFGELQRPDGSVSTELSIDIDFDGQKYYIPTLVPTLEDDEITHLLGGGEITDSIFKKALDHAKGRMSSGQSPFALEGEQIKRSKKNAR